MQHTKTKRDKEEDGDMEWQHPMDDTKPDVKWIASLGQAAALATKYPFIEARFNPDVFKPGQILYGFKWSKELEADAGKYFLHTLEVEALTYWDKIYELKTIKNNLIIKK